MRLPFFRSKDAAPAAAPPAGGDAAVQAARTAARRRLVGALVLLLIGVVGFPLLFETQPRPLPADLPILVTEGNSTRVAPAPAPRPAPPLPADAGAEPVAPAASVAAPAAAPSAPAPAPKPVASAPAPKPAASAAAPRPAPNPETAAAGRFVVQVGAYNEVERLKAARERLTKLGFKTYTQDVETPTGKRTRLRVGPFASRAEAEAAAGKVKASGMQANVLSL